jgi:hypothetical protein
MSVLMSDMSDRMCATSDSNLTIRSSTSSSSKTADTAASSKRTLLVLLPGLNIQTAIHVVRNAIKAAVSGNF